MNDHLAYNRQSVAASLRRLSDAALVAAEVLSCRDVPPGDDEDALRVVNARHSSVTHAATIVDATRRGIAKAAAERVA